MSTASFVQHEQVGPVAVARVTCPSVGQREAPIIQDEITGAANRAAWKVVVDLKSVTMLGSMGIGMLVTLTKLTRDKGGRLAIFGMSDDLLGMIKLTKLDRLLPIVPDQAAALKKMS